MDIEHILNDCLNKAMCQKGRIQKPNSNNIADFVNNYLEAINYTRCCMGEAEQLCEGLHSTDFNGKCFKCGEQVFVRERK